MTAAIPLILCLATTGAPKPIDGLALPLKCLASATLEATSHGGTWYRGTYPAVFFRYSLKAERGEWVRNYLRESGALSFGDETGGGSVSNSDSWYRNAGGVTQSCHVSTDAARPGFILVGISERFEMGKAMPAVWNRAGVHPKPPVPPAEVPFAKGRYPYLVVKATFRRGSDLAPAKRRHSGSFQVAAFPGRPNTAEAAEWAKSHGYMKTKRGTYYKACKGVCEFAVLGSWGGRRYQTIVVMVVSDQKPVQPIPAYWWEGRGMLEGVPPLPRPVT